MTGVLIIRLLHGVKVNDVSFVASAGVDYSSYEDALSPAGYRGRAARALRRLEPARRRGLSRRPPEAVVRVARREQLRRAVRLLPYRRHVPAGAARTPARARRSGADRVRDRPAGQPPNPPSQAH